MLRSSRHIISHQCYLARSVVFTSRVAVRSWVQNQARSVTSRPTKPITFRAKDKSTSWPYLGTVKVKRRRRGDNRAVTMKLAYRKVAAGLYQLLQLPTNIWIELVVNYYLLKFKCLSLSRPFYWRNTPAATVMSLQCQFSVERNSTSMSLFYLSPPPVVIYNFSLIIRISGPAAIADATPEALPRSSGQRPAKRFAFYDNMYGVQGTIERKSVFVVFFQGEQLRSKVKKICDGYQFICIYKRWMAHSEQCVCITSSDEILLIVQLTIDDRTHRVPV